MLLAEIGTYLDAQTSLTLATDLFLSRLPDTPNVCVALFEYQGEKSQETYGTDHAWEKPRLQVLIRDDDYATARLTAQTCHDALTFTNTTLSGVRYMYCQPLQPAFLMHRDDNERITLVFNCEVWKDISAS